MRTSLKMLVVVLALTVAPLSARVAPLVWNLSGVTFSDGGTASGSFTYDASTNTYSGISITTTSGSVRTGASYAFSISVSDASDAGFLTVTQASDQTGLPAIVFQPSSPMTNGGGTLPLLATSEEVTCTSAACNTPINPATVRTMTAGSLTTNAVPTMPVWMTIGAALATFLAAGWFLRRSRRPLFHAAR